MNTAEKIVRLREIITAFPDVMVTVLGDLVADEFVFGEIDRVSREAPVLILKHRERTVLPGGGANAVNNLADLGVRVVPMGIVGDDATGRMLSEYFQKKKIFVDGMLKDKKYATVTKTRILAGMTHTSRQQVVRIDREPQHGPSLAVLDKLVKTTQRWLKKSDALLVSDYGYGSATPAILQAVQRVAGKNTPMVLDSRHRLLEYKGVTAATPNEPEIEEALGVRVGQDWRTLASAGSQVMSRMKLKSLLITRGRHGMVAFDRGRKPMDLPIVGSDEVADVTGAGDTVIAVFTAALAVGASTEDSALLANYAGGIVVMKRGTATVSRSELLHALEQSPPAIRSH
jgi:rfaE bifunctional protein kinase chain/domain